MSVKVLRYGSDAWKMLRGVSAIYKPADMDVGHVLHKISKQLSDDLNSMERKMVTSQGPSAVTSETGHKTALVEPQTTGQLDYSNHPLVLGPGFEPQDFDLQVCGGIGHSYRMSGVTPICINSPDESRKWQALSVPAVYRVTFELGKRTDTLFADGKTIEKSTYKHLERKEGEVVNLLQRTQRNHQKMLFRHANVPLQSQAAYELAVKGVFKPSYHTDGLIYSFNLVSFAVPEVIVDITAINVDEIYIAELIDEIGEKVKTNATTKSIRLMRYGFISLTDCLNEKQWSAKNFIDNMGRIDKLAEKHQPFRETFDDVPLTPVKPV